MLKTPAVPYIFVVNLCKIKHVIKPLSLICNIVDRENFKTVLMHEFGHVIGLTYEGRENSADIYGTHCTDEDGLCIMQQRVDGNFSDITRARLALKRENLPPICSDCIKAGNRFFANERQQSNVNKIVRQTLNDLGIYR